LTTVPPVVDASWCDGRDGVVFCDVRWYLDGRSGRDAYRAGHVPGAVFVDLDACLAAPPSVGAGRHPLPAPAHFAACLGACGIGDDDIVVAYDDAGCVYAARLVWMLRVIGCEAALLDGGLDGWPGPLEAGEAVSAHRDRRSVPWPDDRIASADEVASLGAGAVLVDARAPERYRGETEPVDDRAGHIPGVVNVPTAQNLDRSTGRFLSRSRLRARYEAAGVRDGGNVVCYCGSGITACHDLLALEAAGYEGAKLYPGSWSQWAADRSRPCSP